MASNLLHLIGLLAILAPPSGPSPSAYLLAPGDVVEVTVSTHVGYDRTVTIEPDGRIHLPVAGEVVAAGATLAELARRIEKRLDAELVKPQVSVSLKQQTAPPARRVSVLGAVRSSGSFEIGERTTLAELLALAGGPAPGADLSRITVARADRSRVETVDLSDAVKGGGVGRDVLLAAGDLVLVPAGATPTVTVTGEVLRSGRYDIPSGARVLDAIALAGGLSPRGSLEAVLLTRAGQNRALNLRSGPVPSDDANPLLESGDVVAVSEDENRVYLLGEFARPEGYPLRSGDRLLDLITRAGGPTRDADLAKATLLRRDAQGQPAPVRVDLARLLRKGEQTANLVLNQGDVLFLPGKNPSKPLGLGTVLFPLTSLLRLFMF